ncbi:hypothetical protein [Xanthomonas hortorum]|uniref:hypothetical protein n=1 Tax=Xanthomonas hortorum TaxID=56454 RepID=UPI003D2F82EF
MLSANLGLYGDLSWRSVSILRDLFPQVEVYSIDESFVSFDSIPEAEHERVLGSVAARWPSPMKRSLVDHGHIPFPRVKAFGRVLQTVFLHRFRLRFD